MNRAFWEGFWYGLNPLNSVRVMRDMLGWACYRVVVATPVRMDSKLYCWALKWAGWHAYSRDRKVQE